MKRCENLRELVYILAQCLVCLLALFDKPFVMLNFNLFDLGHHAHCLF